MNIGILNNELGIVGIDTVEDLGYIQVELIRKQMPEGTNIKDLAFFYMSDRDWIVINRAHPLSDFYEEIILGYLGLSEENRREMRIEAPTQVIRNAIYILDGVIHNRAMINGLFSRKAVRCNVI